MDKIIVEIKCPAMMKSYEFRISKRLSAAEGIKKIIGEIRSFEGSEKLLDGELSLFSAKSGAVLCGEMSFAENGVASGDVLMII